MRSMTGFGAASRDRERLAVRAEVRSVNHRYLQVKVRLPGDLAWLESDVEERVRAVLERGSVSVYVALSAGTALTTASINSKAARRYKVLFGELSRDLGIPGELELSTLASLPGVLSADVDTLAQARARRAVLEVVDDALTALTAMREREGQATAKELEAHARRIRKLVLGIKRRMPEVVRRHQASLHARVEVLLGGRGGVRPEDLAREIALLADRMDVSEELGRLQSHLDQLAVIMAREGAVGRALEFLAQEFLREANTIGSKCNDAAVAHDVVELKTLIERLREQVMNVE